eukprot:tig00001071_g6809.t1
MERLDEALDEFKTGLNASALDGVIEIVKDAKSEEQLLLYANAILGGQSKLLEALLVEASKKGGKDTREGKKRGYETLMAVLGALGPRAALFAPGLARRLRATLWRETDAGAAEGLLEVMEAALRLPPPGGEGLDRWAESLQVEELANDCLVNYSKGQRSQTVKGRLLALLGALAEVYPGKMSLDKRDKRIGERILSELRVEMPKLRDVHGRPQMQIMAGAMMGLSAYLANFSDELEKPASPLADEVYAWVMQAVERALEETPQRYALPRGALAILRRHAGLFGRQLVADFGTLLRSLAALCKHKNADLRREATGAAEAFLREACAGMEPSAGPEAARSYRLLLRVTLEQLQAAAVTGDTHVAVLAAEALAGPVARFAGAEDVGKLLERVLAFSERLHRGGAEEQEEMLPFLAPLLRAAAALLHELPAAPAALGPLQRLFAAVFLAYPRLFGRQQSALRAALHMFLAALHAKGSALRALLSDTLFQALVLTVSSDGQGAGRYRAAPAGVADTLEFDVPAYWRIYQELWGSLLGGRLEEADGRVLAGAGRREEVAAAVYDEFMEGAVLPLLRRLDLGYALADPDAPDEPGPGPGPAAPAGEPPPGGGGSQGEGGAGAGREEGRSGGWALPFGREVVAMAQRLPLVSGLDRLLRAALRVLDATRHFEPDGPAPDPAARDGALGVYGAYLEESCVRAGALRDERLVACLEMLLAAPAPCLRFPAFLRPLELALRLGPAIHALAAAALEALERWLDATRGAPPGPRSLLHHLPALAPALEPYLLPAPADEGPGGGADTAALSVALGSGSARGTRSAAALRRRMEERKKRLGVLAARGQQAPEATAWSDLQRRALRVLGRMGGDCHALAGGTDEDDAAGMEAGGAWGEEARVALKLPMRDNKVEVFLDGLLPVLAELAEGAPERATKAAAAEALHALAVHVVALDAFASLARPAHAHASASAQPHAEPKTYEGIYRRLFPVILRLAVDPDQVTRTLFSKLALQLVTWFSRDAHSAELAAAALLEAATEAASSGGGGAAALREFGARCIAAFAKYAVRHQGAGGTEAGAGAVKAVVRRVAAMLRHPDPHRRAGACLALNHPDFYREFREQREAVLRHALPLLQHALAAARAADGDEASLGTGPLAVEAVNHLARIVVRYAGELKRSPKEKKAHAEWSALPPFVARLFSEDVAAPEPRYRHLCTLIFSQLAVLDAPGGNAAAWVRAFEKEHGAGALLRALEGAGDLLAERPAAPPAPEGPATPEAAPFAAEAAVRWLRQLAASCEAYAWVSTQGRLLGAARHFLSTFALCGTTADARLARAAPPAPPAAPEEGPVWEARGAAARALVRLLVQLAERDAAVLAARFAELEPAAGPEPGAGAKGAGGGSEAWLAPEEALTRLLAWALFGASALGLPREPPPPLTRRKTAAPAPHARKEEGPNEKEAGGEEGGPAWRAAQELRQLARRLVAALPGPSTRPARGAAEALAAACAGGEAAAAADLVAGYSELASAGALAPLLAPAGLPAHAPLPRASPRPRRRCRRRRRRGGGCWRSGCWGSRWGPASPP